MIKRIPFKRRRQKLTNYHKRLKLVKSGKTRLVVRLSNRYVRCQFIDYYEDGDKTIVTFDSKKLPNFNGGKNLQSAYLTGLKSGLIALSKGVKNAILDIGLKPSVKNSRIYACVKGVIEAGIKVPVSEEMLPSDELLKKNELSEVIKLIKGDK